MANTTNFGWETPDDTDLVKDGAAAIRTLGNSIDTSLVDLKGGTTGQILSKTSNTDMDFTWVTSAGDIEGVTAGTGISGGGTSGTVTITNSMATAIDAKGDLVAGTGADAFARLAVGTNGQYLVADSTQTTGLKWATPSSGALTLINRTTFSNVASQTIDSVFSSTYKHYLIAIEYCYGAARQNDLYFRFVYSGTVVSSDYYFSARGYNDSGALVGTNGGGAGQITLATFIGADQSEGYSGSLWAENVDTTNSNPKLHGMGGMFGNRGTGGLGALPTFGVVDSATARAWSGFNISADTGNVWGAVSVYGLATA